MEMATVKNPWWSRNASRASCQNYVTWRLILCIIHRTLSRRSYYSNSFHSCPCPVYTVNKNIFLAAFRDRVVHGTALCFPLGFNYTTMWRWRRTNSEQVNCQTCHRSFYKLYNTVLVGSPFCTTICMPLKTQISKRNLF